MVKSETYTHDELDEFAGGLLYHAGLQTNLRNLLSMTAEAEDYALIEFVNHAPVDCAALLLSTTGLVVSSAIRRLQALAEATDAALASLQARMASEGDGSDVTEVFATMMREAFGAEADLNGVSLDENDSGVE